MRQRHALQDPPITGGTARLSSPNAPVYPHCRDGCFPPVARKPLSRRLRSAGCCLLFFLSAFQLFSVSAFAATVSATWNTPTDIPVTAPTYTATGNDIAFTLNCVPAAAELTVIKNTGLAFIQGTFSNLTQGQALDLSYSGNTYHFVANYYGGSGNDLVLMWAGTRVLAWGGNYYGQVGDGTTTAGPPYGLTVPAPVPVTTTGGMGVLHSKTVVTVAAGYQHSLALCSDGTVAAWGSNSSGQLGDNSKIDSSVPVAVRTDEGTSALFGKTVVALAAGFGHSLALCSDGTMAAWGRNASGELGNNSSTESAVPVAVSVTSGVSVLFGKSVVAIAAGGYYNLALCADGTVAAWGFNGYANLGDNTSTQRLAPVAVNTEAGISALYGKTVVAITAGFNHSLALCTDGTIAAWGLNQYGRLGDNTTLTRYAPVAVNRVSGISALSGRTPVAIAAGQSHSVAQCADGTVVAWGENGSGQLGNNSTSDSSVPVTVNMASGLSALFGKTVRTIASGSDNNLALCADGTAVAWGRNYSGELGDGTSTTTAPFGKPVPVAVSRAPLAANERFVLLSNGSMADHTLALAAMPVSTLSLSSDARLASLTLSAGTLEPPFVSDVSNYSASVTADTATLSVALAAVHPKATVKVNNIAVAPGSASGPISLAVGNNTITILVTAEDGSSGTYQVTVNRPSVTAAYNNASDVPVTAPHYTATDRTVNFALNCVPVTGELMVIKNTGLDFIQGTFTNLGQGQEVTLSYGGKSYRFIANYYGGSGNDLVLVSAATRAFAWGRNYYGELGDGTNQTKAPYSKTAPVPVLMNGGVSVLKSKTVTRIATGGDHSLALCSDGTVAAWGRNSKGQLGKNSMINSSVPLAINTASGVSALFGKTVVAVAAGYEHSLALCSDGTVAAWGSNWGGQLGNNSATDSSVPVAVNTTTGVSALFGKTVVAIAAGVYHSLALCSDGTLASWGYNTEGQLGNNGTTNSSVPVAINTTAGVSALFGKTVMAIAAGAYHNLALCSDGTVATWGFNHDGRLGNNSTTNSSVPVVINTTSGVSALFGKTVGAIAAGFSHSLALCSDGTVAAWGYNDSGQLGNNSRTSCLVPVAVDTTSGISATFGKTVVAIAAGSAHSLGLCLDGTVVAWGYNSYGQLGNYSTLASSVPVAVNQTPLTGDCVVHLSSGSVSDSSLALVSRILPSSDARLASLTLSAGTLEPAFTGDNMVYTARVTPETDSLAISPTVAHPDSAVNVNGMSVVSGSASGPVPLTVGGNEIPIVVTAEDGSVRTYRLTVTRLAEYIAVTATYNATSDVPVTAPGYIATGKIVDITLNCVPSTGELMVIKNTGRDFIHGTFGNLAQGQGITLMHDGIFYPFVANYYGGSGNDLVLVRDGARAFAWGVNVLGQLGDNSVTNRSEPVAVSVPTAGVLSGKTVLDIAAGAYHSLALCSDGTVAAWGSNSDGELGDGSTTDRLLPERVNTAEGVSALFGKTVVAIAAGWSHSLALCSDGTVAAWGHNGSGQLGNNTVNKSNVPVAVNTKAGSALFGKTVVAIAAGNFHSLALCSDGTVVAWGYNIAGQLGDNTATDRAVPVAVNTAPGVSVLFGKTVAAIAAGTDHSLALCSDGTLAAWGANWSGQLGDGTTSGSLVPVAVNAEQGLSALGGKIVTAIAAGATHSLALCSDGSVAAWGNNDSGKLGNNSTTNCSVPLAINTDSGVSALFEKTVVGIAAGSYHSLALCSDGTAASWGVNGSGTLGNNSTVQSPVPVAVSLTPLDAGERFTHIASSSSASHSLGIANLPVPPTVATLAATDVTNTRATLNGTVNANGFGPNVTFDYGITTAYGTTIAGTPNPVTGTGAVAVSAGITGLNPDTLYHYRVNGGFTHGEDQTFTTDPTSNNADLSSLTISEGALAPAFTTAILNYTASTTPETDVLTLTPHTAHPRATVQVNGISVASGSASAPVTLVVGSNVIAILVTANDGSTKSYRVTVTRPEATLILSATYNTTGDVPVTSSQYTATGKTIDITLNCEPSPGDLRVINNTGLNFIHGVFDNLKQGQRVTLSYMGQTYYFVANYYGGSGNDLVLVWCGTKATSWGYNNDGQLGDNSKTSRSGMMLMGDMMTNTGVLFGRTVVAVAAGGSHSLALCSDGTVAAWGYNWSGQLGNNSTTESLLPVKVSTAGGVSALFGKTVVAIAAGSSHSLALCSDGTVAAWGYNGSGALGNNSTTESHLPVRVNTAVGVSALFGKTVVAIAAGGQHSLARCSDGTVVAWGNNSVGQLGDNSRTNRNVPVAVNTAAGVSALVGKTVTAIAAGSAHSLALCSDGTVAAWGSNWVGELGDGAALSSETICKLVPVAVNTTTGISALFGKVVTAIAAGGSHSLALCTDGTVVTWGINNYGQLGDDIDTASSAPVAVNTQDGISALFGKSVISITAGGDTGLAVCSDGTLAAWGSNWDGQLGITGMTKSNVPVEVSTWTNVTHISSGSCARHNLALWADSIQYPAPTCVPATVTDLTQTSVQLNGLVNTQSWGGAVTFAYGTDGVSFPNQVNVTDPVTGGDLAVGVAVSGLTKGTTYYFRLEVASAAGRAMSEVTAFITRTEPTAVLAGTARVLSSGVELSGSVNAKGSDTQVFIDYGTSPTSLLFSVPATPVLASGYSDTPVSGVLANLTPATTYYYQIHAKSVAGDGISVTASFQVAMLSGFTQIFPNAPPDAQGYVIATLQPSGIAAGWRFVGEQQWRASGVPAGGLATGDRMIEFRPVPGYVQPPPETVGVVSGEAATFLERTYYQASSTGSGGMSVTLKPESLAAETVPGATRAQWRLLGEDDTHWRDSGVYLTALPAGNYLIECKPVTGRTTPTAISVRVQDGQTAAPTITYYLADAVTGMQPSLVPFATVTTDPSKPYAYVGQIRSDVGSSSGFVVKPRVVATAGHVVFDDGTLSAVGGLQWLFERHRGTYEPKPQIPRGFYIFDGYAAQRAAENTPGTSSPQSQNLDAAALYFTEDAGRGGYGGYLASDLDTNEFLSSSSQKMLVGYPVDGIVASNQGRMHATPPANATFARAFGHTYTTTGIRSSGGGSGGPLCIQYQGGNYYPAAIYLGGSGQTVVRSIDSSVIDLFNRAEVSGNGGDNNTGGGITHTSIATIGTATQPGILKVNIEPAAARAAGAGWLIAPEALYRLSGSQKSGLSAGGYIVQLSSVSGFQVPTQQAIQVDGGQIKEITFTYLVGVPPPSITSANTLTGTRGRFMSYQIAASQSPAAYSIAGSLPMGLLFDSTAGLISGTPQEAGVFAVTLGATNAGGTGSKVLAITCRPTLANQSASVPRGQPLNLQLSSSESGPSVSYSADILPDGLHLNEASGLVTGSPLQAGIFPTLLTVSKDGASASAILTLTVTATPLDIWRLAKFGTTSNDGVAANTEDPDHDGQTNLSEYVAGTNPNNAADVLRVLTTARTGSTFTLTASGKAGRTYSLQRRTDLASGIWDTVITTGPLAADVPLFLTDQSAPAGNAFYRIQVTVP